MNYIISRFTKTVQFEDKMLLYNSYTEHFGVLELEVYKKLLANIGIINEKHPLVKYGFVVETNTDEYLLGKDKANQYIYSGILDLTIFISADCNLNCVYCFEVQEHVTMADNVIQRIIQFIQHNIRHYAQVRIEWFGGEPLLAKSKIYAFSDSVIDVCRKTSRLYSATITTNGVLLDVATFKELIRRKVYTYIITLDGLPEIHDKYRRGRDNQGSFFKILNNLRSIRDNVKTNTFSIVIRTNVTTETYQSLNEYISLLYKEFGKDNRFAFVFSPVYDWGGNSVKEISDKMVYTLSPLYQKIIEINYPLNFSLVKEDLRNHICKYGQKNTYSIDVYGNLLRCPQEMNEFYGKFKNNGILEKDDRKIATWCGMTSVGFNDCQTCNDYPLCLGKSCIRNLRYIKAYDRLSNNCKQQTIDFEDIIRLLYHFHRNLFISI